MTKGQFMHAMKMIMDEKRAEEKKMDEYEKEHDRVMFIADINEKIAREDDIILHVMVH